MLGMLASGLSTGANAGLQGLQTVFGWLSSALRFVGGQLMGLGGLLMRLGTLLSGVLIGGLGAFATAIGASTRAALEHAKGISSLRSQIGMPLGQAQAVSNRFAAFGFSPGDLTNNGQYHGITRMMGGAYGVNPYDPASINARAQSFGGGMFGHAMKKGLLGSLGMDNESGHFLASLRPSQVRGQMAWQSNMTSTMGVDSSVISKFATDIPLLMNRFEQFRHLLMVKIAGSALPFIERGFERLSGFLSANGGKIGESVGRAVEWTMGKLEQLGGFLMKQWPAISQTVLGAFQYLWDNAPQMAISGAQTVLGAFKWLSDGFFTTARTVVNFLRVLENANSGLGQFVGGFFQAIDGLGKMGKFTADAFHFLGDMWHDFIAMISNVFIGAIKGLFTVIDILPKKLKDYFFDDVGQQRVKALRSIEFEPLRNSHWGDYTKGFQPSNLAGQWKSFQDSGKMSGWADAADAALNRGQSFVDDKSSAVGQFLADLAQKTSQAQKADAETQTEVLKRIDANTAATAEAAKKSNALLNPFQQQTADRVISYIATDTGLATFGQ